MSTKPMDEGRHKAQMDDRRTLWNGFEKMSAEHVEQVSENMHRQLDTLMLFAALFAGIAVAFLVLSLPLSIPAPADETNALLRQLIRTLSNSTEDATTDTSNVDAIRQDLHTVNQLFCASLTCTLVASFGVVLGKQWLNYLVKDTEGSGLERRRVMQLKIVGAEMWRLQRVLEITFPTIIQAALVLFIAGFILFIKTFDRSLADISMSIAIISLSLLVIVSGFALWDPSCPFKSPWTQAVHPLMWRLELGVAYQLVMLPINISVILERLLFLPCIEGASFQSWLASSNRVLREWASLKAFWRTYDTYWTEWGAAKVRRQITQEELDARTVVWVLKTTQDTDILGAMMRNLLANYDPHFLRTVLRRGLAEELWALHLKPQAEMSLEQHDLPYSELFMHLYLSSADPDPWLHDASQEVLRGISSPSEHLITASKAKRILHQRFDPDRFKEVDEPQLDVLLHQPKQQVWKVTAASSPETISMAAWALVNFHHDHEYIRPDVHKIRSHQLWLSYMSETPIYANIAAALQTYIDTDASTSRTFPAQRLAEIVSAAKAWTAVNTPQVPTLMQSTELVKMYGTLIKTTLAVDQRVVEEVSGLVKATFEHLGGVVRIPSPEVLNEAVNYFDTSTRFYQEHPGDPDSDILGALGGVLRGCEAFLEEDFSADNPNLTRAQLIEASGRVIATTKDPDERFAAALTSFISTTAHHHSSALSANYMHWASELALTAFTYYLENAQPAPNGVLFARRYGEIVNDRSWAGLFGEATKRRFRKALERVVSLTYEATNSREKTL